MARRGLSPELERVRQGLLMCPHKAGQLLSEPEFVSISSMGEAAHERRGDGERTLTKYSPSSESMFYSSYGYQCMGEQYSKERMAASPEPGGEGIS